MVNLVLFSLLKTKPKLLTKIKANFSDFEQQLFLSSFYCYLNCDHVKDFVIDLDNVWKWLGFRQKVNAKMLLEKQFIIDKDYIKSLLLQQKRFYIIFINNKLFFQ